MSTRATHPAKAAAPDDPEDDRHHAETEATTAELFESIAEALADHSGDEPTVPTSILPDIVRIGNALQATYAVFPLVEDTPPVVAPAP